MRQTSKTQSFTIRLELLVAGPIQPRRKYKPHKLLHARACIVLPFAPFPGLYLTYERPRPRRRGDPDSLYLRVRTVEWSVSKQEFTCVVDEILGSNVFLETSEVRDGARIEEHFSRLQPTLRAFGFDLNPTAEALYWALDKRADGTPMTAG